MTTIINGSSPSITFSDSTTQTTAFTTGAVTQSTIATGVAGTGPAFSAYQSSAQTITASSFTKLTLNAKNFDTANAFDSTTNYRFQPQVAGYYQINGACQSGTVITASQVILLAYKNGTNYATLSSSVSVSGYPCPAGSSVVYLNGSTDYLEFYFYQNSAGSITTVNASSLACSGSLIRSA